MTYEYNKEKQKYPLPKCSLCDKEAPVLENGRLLCSYHWLKLNRIKSR